ncbi:DUF3267 domain-containing protein [Bacillus sp. FJAT-29790]|uniref:DUF3267 domain-containing protein n=1 Tax=Bacillus sp. FJAT-29790 TaxID=1895002 RepID=UPI001C20FDAB|nr:DUF3267 domain-containing protein [Bacillus sp. FJAT-29790]MBU8880012.1 DUF3267 domain-containing protein [Bacillus sp. FJAT-29790]
MNCWKTVNFTKQYGSQRLFIMSSLTTLLTFIFIYVPAQYLFEATTFYDNYFLLFVVSLWLMYPIHKFFHYLPIAHHSRKVKKSVTFKYGIFPIIQIRVHEPMSKWLFMFALFTPFLVINSILLWACFIFPHYVHYFTILLAFHVGLCLPDLIWAKNVLSAPNRSYIEESEDGIEILLHNN